jgi:CBS-domain-containing membrane protein
MEVKRAADLMIPLGEYPHVPYWFSLREAIAVLERSQIEMAGRKSLPRAFLVFNEAYELLGIVRRRDILRGLGPRFLVDKPVEHSKALFEVKVDPNLSEMHYEKILTGLQEQAQRSVAEVMQPVTVTIQSEDHLMKIIFEMVHNDLSMIPVLENGAVVGVVRSVDVLEEVARLVV